MRNAATTIKGETKLTTFATRMPQTKALEHLMAYQRAFNARYVQVTAVNFKIMSICEVKNIPTDVLNKYQTLLIEDLKTSPEEF